jgi:hypothetical protein
MLPNKIEEIINFKAIIQGVGELWFQSFEDVVVGVETKIAPATWDRQMSEIVIPGGQRMDNRLTLRYLIGVNIRPLLNWFDAAQQGHEAYRNISVLFQDTENRTRLTMDFLNAFPSAIRLSYGIKNAPVSVIDSVEFWYEQCERQY